MKLYKYSRLSQGLLANLAKKTVWVSAASKFNDLFDCQYHEDDSFNQKMAKELQVIKKHREEKGASGMPLELPDGELDDTQIHEFRKTNFEFMRQFLNGFGILSLSEVRDSLLLWSHYGDNHYGVCLEYEVETEDPNDNDTLPVTYSTQYPKLSIYDFNIDIVETTKQILTTKSMEWAYEKEWRYLVLDKQNMEITRPFKLTGIIFGARLTTENKETIRAVVKDSISYWQAKQSPQQFKIHIESL